MKLIDKKKFVKAVLDKNVEAFVIHVMSFNFEHLAQKAQIAFLLTKEVKILTKYLDFLDIFLEEKTSELPEVIKLNQYAINFQEDQQLPYRLIYNLGLIELEILKTYIKINLANGFIQFFKSFTGALILFV